jgi:hypothetical protein
MLKIKNIEKSFGIHEKRLFFKFLRSKINKIKIIMINYRVKKFKKYKIPKIPVTGTVQKYFKAGSIFSFLN